MSLIETLHGGYVHKRRVHRLAECLARLIPEKARVLDVGTGDGWLAKMVADLRPDIQISGIDLVVRENPRIPVTGFDGRIIPFEDLSFDVAIFIDVLHHTENPAVLMSEARRVARQGIILKEHLCQNALDRQMLKFMDVVGNLRYGIPITYNYKSREEWMRLFDREKLTVASWNGHLGLYPAPFNWIFERKMHFMAMLLTNHG